MVGVAVGVEVGTGEALGTDVTLGAAVVGIADGTMPPVPPGALLGGP